MKAATANAVSFRRDAAESPGTGHALLPGSGANTQDHRTTPLAYLTPRQIEVLSLLCEGLPNKLICRRLNIATGTVKVHISCILRELGVTSRLQAVVAARSLGFPGDHKAGTPNQGTVATPAGEPVKATRSRASAASGRVAVAA